MQPASKGMYSHKCNMSFFSKYPLISAFYFIAAMCTVHCCFFLLTKHSYNGALPLSMDIPPLIRPVLPSPLKHDGTRRAVVAQWHFLIERRTNTFTHAQTKTHGDRHLMITAPDRTYSDAIVWTSRSDVRKRQRRQTVKRRRYEAAQLLTNVQMCLRFKEIFKHMCCNYNF